MNFVPSTSYSKLPLEPKPDDEEDFAELLLDCEELLDFAELLLDCTPWEEDDSTDDEDFAELLELSSTEDELFPEDGTPLDNCWLFSLEEDFAEEDNPAEDKSVSEEIPSPLPPELSGFWASELPGIWSPEPSA